VIPINDSRFERSGSAQKKQIVRVAASVIDLTDDTSGHDARSARAASAPGCKFFADYEVGVKKMLNSRCTNSIAM